MIFVNHACCKLLVIIGLANDKYELYFAWCNLL